MDPERQRVIASQGGGAAHASGNAHQFTPEEARAAGARSHINRKQESGSRNAASARHDAREATSRKKSGQ